jgi:hypothetical protein
VLNTIIGYEAYYFLTKYSRYHQIFIAPENKDKTTFVTWGAFIWKVMTFGVQNGPPIY